MATKERSLAMTAIPAERSMRRQLGPRVSANEAGSQRTSTQEASVACTPRSLNLASKDEFSKIYRAHVRFVWRGLRACGIPDSEVQDVAQEVFLIVLRRLPDYDPTTNMRTWVYGIARRVAANRRRASSRTERREACAAADEPQSIDPELSLTARRDLAKIQATLEQLDPAASELFFLFYLEDLSSREIGELLDVNIHTINTRLRALRKRLRARLSPDGSAATERAVIDGA